MTKTSIQLVDLLAPRHGVEPIASERVSLIGSSCLKTWLSGLWLFSTEIYCRLQWLISHKDTVQMEAQIRLFQSSLCGGYKISWAMLTCGNHGNPSSLPTSVRRIAHLHLLTLFLKSLSKGCGSCSHAFLTTHLIHEILCHNQTNHSYQKQMWQKDAKIIALTQKLSCKRWALESRASWRLGWLTC